MRSVEFLIEHMNHYNNTVVILGQDVISHQGLTVDDGSEEDNVIKNNFNRRTLVKFPEQFWGIYNNIIAGEEEDSFVYPIVESLKAKTIYNQSISSDSKYDFININGHVSDNICTKCKKKFSQDEMKDIYACDICNVPIYPSTLLRFKKTRELKAEIEESIVKANTIFLIGVDLRDKDIRDAINKYMELKKNQGENAKRLLIVIEEESPMFNVEELGFVEYLIRGNIDETMNRFNKVFTKTGE